MANKKQNTTIARVSDLPIMKKIWDGMYTILAYNKKNYRIPKTVEQPAELTLADCKKLIEESESKPATAKKRTVRKKA